MPDSEECIPERLRTAEGFGTHLRELRGRLTQETVAKRSLTGPGGAALPRQRVSNIENGLLPTAEQLRCYLHGCGRPELFDELDVVRRRLAERTRRSPAPRRRLAIIGGTAVAVVAIVVAVVALTGSAHDTPAVGVAPQCAENFVCFWADRDFTGVKIQQSPDWASTSHCIRLPYAIRSVMNNTKERQRGFANSDCSDSGTVLQNYGGREPSVDINAYKHT